MKQINIIAVAAVFTLVVSCKGTSSESEKDKGNGYITLKENGLTCKEAYLENEDGERGQEVTFGDKVTMTFQGVEGFQEENGFIKTDISMIFRKPAGDTLMFVDYGTLDPLIREVNNKRTYEVNLYAPVKTPMYSGKEFEFICAARDLLNPENKIEGAAIIKVRPNESIKVESNGLEAKEVAIFDSENKEYITDQKITVGKNYSMMFAEPKGFELNNGMAKVGASLAYTDKEGESYTVAEDVFADYAEGIPYDKVQEALSLIFFVGSDYLNQDVQLTIRIWDKNSDADITATTTVSVTE